MTERSQAPQVDEFVLAAIDSVPHLESLLLLWTTRPRVWQAEEIAEKLYVPPGQAREVLETLIRRGLVCAAGTEPVGYRYAARSIEQDELLAAVERQYKFDLIRMTRMIHSKAAPGVREFAQAFRFKKDKE